MADPRELLSPAELLTFVELDGLREDWEALRLDEDDLLALQVAIMRAPEGDPAIIERQKGVFSKRSVR